MKFERKLQKFKEHLEKERVRKQEVSKNKRRKYIRDWKKAKSKSMKALCKRCQVVPHTKRGKYCKYCALFMKWQGGLTAQLDKFDLSPLKEIDEELDNILKEC